MARTSTISRKQIIKAAFQVCKNNGIKGLTVRSIAGQIGCSTAPIYTQFENMEGIINELTIYINQQLMVYMEKNFTIDPFLNLGAGTVAFVLEFPLIFKDFFINKGYSILEIGLKDKQIKLMSTNPFLALLGKDRLNSLLEDMSIYTMGLTLSICNAKHKKTLDYYIEKLETTGSKLIHYHMISSGNLENAFKLFNEKASEKIDMKEVIS